MEVIREICRDAATKYPDSVTKAACWAKSQAAKRGGFDQWKDELADIAIERLIRDARAAINTAYKKGNGEYGGPAKVTAGAAANAVAMRCYYDYGLGGTCLGNLKAEELLKIAESEETAASGHMFNVKLCRKLAPMLKADKTVRECVSETKLGLIFREL